MVGMKHDQGSHFGRENDDSDFGEENDTENTEIQVPTEYRI